MNFFGLTSLGPRSALGHFAVAQKHQKLSDVSDQQLLDAFAAFDTLKDGTIARKQLRALLDHMYNHPPPENEVFLFFKFFDSHSSHSGNKNMKYFAIKNFSNRRISKAEFVDAIAYVRGELNSEQGVTGELNKAFLPAPKAAANPNAPTVILTSLATQSASPFAFAPVAPLPPAAVAAQQAAAAAAAAQQSAAATTTTSPAKPMYASLAAARAGTVIGSTPSKAAPSKQAEPSPRAGGSALAAAGRSISSSPAPAGASTAAAAAASGSATPTRGNTTTLNLAPAVPGVVPAIEFKSNSHLRDKMKKHTRLAYDPKDKFRAPVTTSHEYGWFEAIDAERVAVCPKNSCPETMFASEMVKSGIYF